MREEANLYTYAASVNDKPTELGKVGSFASSQIGCAIKTDRVALLHDLLNDFIFFFIIKLMHIRTYMCIYIYTLPIYLFIYPSVQRAISFAKLFAINLAE